MQLVGPVLTGSLHQSQYLLVVWSGNFMAKTGILSTSNVFDCSPAIIMAGFFLCFLFFVID